MKKLLSIVACGIMLVHCQKSEAPKVDERDKFVGSFKGTLNMRSDDSQINDNVYESWTVTKSGAQINVSRQLKGGVQNIIATVSNSNLNMVQVTTQAVINGSVVTLVVGPGQCALNGTVLSVDLPFTFSSGNTIIPGSFVGNLLKQ